MSIAAPVGYRSVRRDGRGGGGMVSASWRERVIELRVPDLADARKYAKRVCAQRNMRAVKLFLNYEFWVSSDEF